MLGESAGGQIEGITVVGEGTVRVVPDQVVLTIGVEQMAATAAHALNEAAGRVLRVVRTLQEWGIGQNDIQTTWVGVYPFQPQAAQAVQGAAGGGLGTVLQPAQMGGPAPASASQFGSFGLFPQNVAGSSILVPQSANYIAGTWLRVTLHDPQRMGEVLDAAIGAGANFSSGVTLRVHDEATAQRAALDAAGKDARVKAETLAAAIGKKLGAPLGAVEEPQWGSLGMLGGGLGAATAPLGASANVMPTAPGELVFAARVRVRYALA